MELDFGSTKEVAEKIGITERWIQQLCKDGKIEGAIRLGGTGMWLVPKGWIRAKALYKERNYD